VYPALVVLEAIKDEFRTDLNEANDAQDAAAKLPDGLSVLWVGSQSGMEFELVNRLGIPFEAISSAGVHGVGVRDLPRALIQLWRGFWQSGRILRRFQPDVLFFTGGYVGVPMAVAGWRRPKVLFVPDIEPGLALKTLAPLSDRVAVTSEESVKYFPRHHGVTVTGYPVRSNLEAWSEDEAYQTLVVSPDLPTLLVMGGSKGARAINQALITALPQLLAEMQVIHISGKLDWTEIEAAQAALVDELGGLAERYRVFPYLHEELGAAYTLADLVLSRAGASSLGEYPAFGLPAILVPYPHAWRYQQINAQYLADRGAALIITEEKLKDRLVPVVRDLMRDRARLKHMQACMRTLDRPDAPRAISQLLQDFATKHSLERT
jgi:UDP-N-acetylglucosamine--N-acetylmuramyl-(pentapeptide) pyrophosphoryl-undecaprenol N-acetylglucosamine transferase